MANIKEVDIEALVPFHWTSRHDHPDLTDEDLAFMAGLFMNPSIGITIHYEEEGYVPNSNGGQTCMYRMWIHGREALAWSALDRIMAVLAKIKGCEVIEARAKDIEDRGNWYPLSPDRKD